MKINLVAVQARPKLEDYASFEAFRLKMTDLMGRACAAVDLKEPTLVAFPEAIGLYLSFVPYHYERISTCATISQAALRVLPRLAPRLLPVAWRHRSFHPFAALFLYHALEVEEAYVETFSTLARQHGVYLLGGSLYVPPIEQETMKGRYLLSGRVHNTAYLFAPNGLCLGKVPKVNLTPGIESLAGFSGAARSDLAPIDTALGRVGILVCYDGFHRGLVEHYDALGAQIILQPSYNEHAWDAANPQNPSYLESEVWLEHGLASLVQGRESILYAVNPMMVGRILNMDAEGRSTISRNTGRVDAGPDETIVAIAESPTAEEIVAATVDIEPARQAEAAPA